MAQNLPSPIPNEKSKNSQLMGVFFIFLVILLIGVVSLVIWGVGLALYAPDSRLPTGTPPTSTSSAQ